uniref:Uncharacterized protein n=1 Tax=Rhizophora mucronata TaxID=61149 RepID=A0A2P2PNJ5_RHIMU
MPLSICSMIFHRQFLQHPVSTTRPKPTSSHQDKEERKGKTLPL